jgi:hypothetical protein
LPHVLVVVDDSHAHLVSSFQEEFKGCRQRLDLLQKLFAVFRLVTLGALNFSDEFRHLFLVRFEGLPEKSFSFENSEDSNNIIFTVEVVFLAST